MRTLHRRLLGVGLGGLSLFATTGIDLLSAAQVSNAATAELMAVRETVEVFDRDGRRLMYFEGKSYGSSAIHLMKALRDDPKFVAQWRETVLKYAARSKKGVSGVATTLQLINALSAQSDAEYHARVRELPVELTKVSRRDQVGRDGVETTFRMHGVVKLRVFRVTEDSPPIASTPNTSGEVDEDNPLLDGDSGQSVDANGTRNNAIHDECAPDTCATQQDRDDALITAVAMDDENSVIDAEMQAESDEFDEWCDNNPEDCWVAGLQETPVSGPSVTEDHARPCNSERNNLIGALATTHGTALIFIAVLAAPGAVAVGLVAGSILLVAGGLFWSYSGAESFRNCAMSLK
jgi:hypothetical protein